MNGPLGSVPALVIRLELERAPVIYTDALNDAEVARLDDWIASHYDFVHLVDAARGMAA